MAVETKTISRGPRFKRWSMGLVAVLAVVYLTLSLQDPPVVPRPVFLPQPAGSRFAHCVGVDDYEYERQGLVWQKVDYSGNCGIEMCIQRPESNYPPRDSDEYCGPGALP